MSDTGFDELPADTSALLKFAEAGFINVAGGCCGTTPDHIQAIGEILSTVSRAPCRKSRSRSACPAWSRSPSTTLAVRQRRRAHQRHRLQGLRAHDPQRAVRRSAGVARQQVENGAQVIDINMDEAMLDSQAAMTRFLNLIASEPDISRVPIMIDSSKWSVIEAGLKCVQGKSIVNSISMKEGEEEFIRQAKLCRATAPPSSSWPSTKKARPTPSSARSRSASAPTRC
jgi:5-methyltetrahydrofolate--homocysteine methyltransferase